VKGPGETQPPRKEGRPDVKRLPPSPLLVPLVVTSVAVWAVARTVLSIGARVMASVLGTSPDLSPLTLLLLALAVSWVVLLDLTVSRERVFAQNLGVAPVTVLGIGFASALLCETGLAAAPALLSLFRGG
jgi:hypothetical protein